MNMPEKKYPVSAKSAEWIVDFDSRHISPRAIEFAKHALLDCFGCMIAGGNEPLVDMMREEFIEGSGAECTLVAGGQQVSLFSAALLNGAAAHALDYDDVHFRLHGHPTTCIAPAVLALGERLGSSGLEVLEALIVGTEVACALGEMCEDGHYEAGFHATGTMGTFGAAAGAARLHGLDVTATVNALGIAASQAAGLKVNFGTMTKPFHAGKAAMNGLMAARLARRGFSASDVAIEGPQGFAQAQVSGFNAAPIRADTDAPFAVEELLYKFHASCYLTHSTLNAIEILRRKYGFSLADVKAVSLQVKSTHQSVCCIPRPQSGLEIKFSIQHLAALALEGVKTGALSTFCLANATDARICRMRERITLDLCPDMVRTAAAVTITLEDGRILEAEDDVGRPDQDAGSQWQKLSDKFQSLCLPKIGATGTAELVAEIKNLDVAGDLNALMSTARG